MAYSLLPQRQAHENAISSIPGKEEDMQNRFVLTLACLLVTSSLQAHTSQTIGYKAGKEMAERLWNGKYGADCFRSDHYLADLQDTSQRLTQSSYHQGYRKGLDQASDRIAQKCHGTAPAGQTEASGECFETGTQHGQNLGQQVCEQLIPGFRIANTCSREALASCYDGLRRYVTRHCSFRLSQPTFRRAQLECESAFARG
jgi:hypothetical protein